MPILLDGRLEKFGVREHHVAADHSYANDHAKRCLRDDEQNFLWVFSDEQGFVESFTRYGFNDAKRILAAISEELRVEIVSEHEPRFWGYETQEEWNAAHERFAEECKMHEEHFWKEVVRFARGEIAGIKQNLPVLCSAEVEKAEIAKRVIGELPELAAEDRRPDLIKEVEKRYIHISVKTGRIPF